MSHISLLATPFDRAFRLRTSGWEIMPPRQDDPRSPFDRDRDRILHSPSFRRLNHKTQVVFNPQNDHLRTRLTHSLEVSQIARSLARHFQVSESLTEAISLAHDLGHPPFGHAGEEAIDAVCHSLPQPFRFHHNDQTLRIICILEERYTSHNPQGGLDLTSSCLEGIAKHNGPLLDETPDFLSWYKTHKPPFSLHTHAGLEAQIAAISDDIAYLSHDLDDALRFEAIQEKEIFDIVLIDKVIRDLAHNKKISLQAIPSPVNRRSLLVRHLIHFMVRDVMETLTHNLKTHNISSYNAVINFHDPLVSFSPSLFQDAKNHKNFLFKKFYRGGLINDQRTTFKNMTTRLLTALLSNPLKIHHFSHPHVEKVKNTEYPPRIIVDYVAGMTDRFALDTYKELYGENDDLYKKALEYGRFSL